MCRTELFWIERDGGRPGGSELPVEGVPLFGVEVAVGAGEVPVDLEEGVVVGGLGVGA